MSPREEFTQIQIDYKGVWYTGQLKITNPKILRFFKKNLYRDKKGIYIYNTFTSDDATGGVRQLSEKGYIQVKGPLLAVVDIAERYFILENDEKLSFQDAKIILDENLTPYAKISRLQAWSIFSSKSAVKFGEIVEERDGQYFWLSKLIEVSSVIAWS